MTFTGMSLTTWAAFTASSAILLVIPGPTILLVVSYAIGSGLRAALPAAIGVALGDFTAMTLSLAGLGALLAASATLFTVLNGAAPPIWSGSASSCGGPAAGSRSRRAPVRRPLRMVAHSGSSPRSTRRA